MNGIDGAGKTTAARVLRTGDREETGAQSENPRELQRAASKYVPVRNIPKPGKNH